MSVKIIADSSCDLPLESAKQAGIDLVPFHVLFCENGTVREYTHNQDLTTEQFYQKLATAQEHPRTAQPSPHEFLKAYKSNSHYDEIICLTVTSKMAGMFDSACIAAELYANEVAKNGGGTMPIIRTFDTQNCSGGATLLALHAAELARKGKNASEIIASLTQLREKVASFFVLNSFVYAFKSGRACGIKPILGQLLGVKPVLTFENGVARDTDLIKSGKQVNRYLVDTFRSKAANHSIAVIFHAMAESRAAELQQELKAHYPDIQTLILSVGAVVGVFTGPGCIGLSFIIEEDCENCLSTASND
ncbi:MAG: DegV family protein [Christensenellales bacterium]|jgi:DegV family protein with EDD domain